MPQYVIRDTSETIKGIRVSYKVKGPHGLETTVNPIAEDFNKVIAKLRKLAEKDPNQFDLELEKEKE